MTALETVQHLKQQAVDVLLNEREQIDRELNQLGYGQEKATLKKRGRPLKATGSSQPSPTDNSQSVPM